MKQKHIAALATLIPLSDTAPDAIQLLPAGTFRALDGRPADVASWQIDAALAATLAQAATARANPYVIDFEHQTLRAAENGQPAPAAGWFKDLEYRESGLWATGVEWTARASAMIASGEYKFISPVFMYDKAGRVTRLLHAALTNDPALDGMASVAALAFNFDPPTLKDTPMTPEMLQLLGLAETATEDDALNALTALLEKANTSESAMVELKAKTVPMVAMQELQAQVAVLNRAALAREIDDLVTPALADGRLLDAMEPWARELGMSNLAALKGFLDKAQPIAALSGMQSRGKAPATGTQGTQGTLSNEEMTACTLLGQSPSEYMAFKATLIKE